MTVLESSLTNGVLVLTLNRPDRLNALDGELVDLLTQTFERLRQDSLVRVVVLKGAGRGFCAGGDLKARPDRASILAGGWQSARLIQSIRACPQPVIGLIHGPVVGAGLALALATDIRLGAKSLRLKVGLAAHGLHASELGIAWLLQQTLAPSRAREFMLTNREIGGEEAETLGLVSRTVPDQDLESQGLALAHEIAASSARALSLSKRTFDLSLGFGDLISAIESDERAQSLLVAMRPTSGETVDEK